MTDIEITEKLAEWFGLEILISFPNRLYVYVSVKNKENNYIHSWNPLEDILDAIKLWDKIIEEDYTLTMSEYKKDPMVIIYIGDSFVEAETKSRAICKACLEIIDDIENGDKL